MKYWYIVLVTFSLLTVNQQLNAQTINPNCFDPGHPEYRSTRCVVQRFEGDDGNGNLFNCDDDVDNDGNGLTDCEEPSCNCTPPPQPDTETDCGDGIDNDGDGDIDCQDRLDCGGSVLCENDCGDGIDNDGDGFFDYYDGDCLADPDNPNNFIVIQPDCEAVPTGNAFSIQVADSSANRTSAALGMPMVADVDNDGTPEVITANSETGRIHVLDGSDLTSIEAQANFGSNVRAYPVVADVDGDDLGEIFIVGNNNSVRAYHHDLTPYWNQASSGFPSGRVINVADFNLDGTPELYQVNEIRDATTGAVLIAGSHGSTTYPSANNWQNDLNSASVAVDILPDAACADCSGLELVVGHIIYSVDIDNNQLTEELNMDDATTLPADYRAGGYHPKNANFTNQTWSTTSTVDFNQDGHLDILMGGTTGNQNGPTSVFFWDIQNSEVSMFIVARPGNTIAANRGNFRDLNGGGCGNSNELCTWRRGVGTLNIADIDADGQLEVTFMSGSSLYALNSDFSLQWENHDEFWESSSGFTGTTVFDFDGDGASEVIYRDEINLYIVDGVSGRIVSGFLDGSFCSSQTQGEYPIVADVDGDGETEIIVSCGQERNEYGEDPVTSGTRTNGHIKVYKAADNNYWVPARQVWNQFSYFNVNINDDLSVPRFAQPHHLSFSQLCNDPTAATAFPLNKFLNQSPRISYCGDLVFPAAKLDFAPDSTRIFPPECPNQEFRVRLFFENNGDEEVSSPIPISFYSENPEQAYADTDQDPHFSVIEIDPPAGGLLPGSFIDTTLTVTGPRGDYTLYASLNDIGPYDELGNKIANSAFYPLDEITGPIRECDNTPTIVSIDVTPTPFSVQVQKIQDNRNCPGAITTENNGEAQVRAADGSALPESEYNFTWTNIADGTVVGTSSFVNQLDSGTYEVMIEFDNGVYTCQGVPDTVRIERLEDWPTADSVTIEEVQAVSSCAPGIADGHLRALLNGSPPDLTNYSIYWTDEQEGDTLAIGAEATNLVPLLYKIVVNNLLTGCSETVTYDLTLDIPQIDSLTATANTNCTNPNGTIAVEVVGDEADYDYMLIQLSPAQDTTFSTVPSFSNLSEGIYEVRAYNPSNDCGLYTQGEEVTVENTSTINNIPLVVEREQTACRAPFNGQLRANVPDPAQYSWVWYRGTDTSSPSAVVVGNNHITPDTLSTNLTIRYTVVVTDTVTGCTFTTSIDLPNNPTPPVVSNVNVLQNQTTCNPNGQAQVTASGGGATPGYRYTIRRGSVDIATNTSGLFTGLEAGPYTAVVEDTTTNCVSPASSIFSINANIVPFGNVAFSPTPQTNCNATNPDGALSVTVDGTTTGYTFRWFVGVDTSSAYSPQPNSNQLTGIAADDYAVRIYNQTTGCDTVVYTTLADNSIDYQETITATKLSDQIFCNGTFSGSIEAGLQASTSGGTPDTANYTYYWYQGTKNDVRNASATLITGQNNSVITGLDVGWYSVRAVRNDGFGCAALDTAEVFIRDERDFPISNINVTIIEQTSCDSNDQNGGLRGDVSGNTTGYTFRWYQLDNGVDIPVTTNNPGAVASGASLDNIGVGTYILEVENDLTGCTGRAQVYLGDNIISGDEIRLNLASTDATNCTPPNGVAQVTSIDLSEDDGATFTDTGNLADFTYQWYRGDDTTDPILLGENASAQSAQLVNVEPGEYTVVATNINSTCVSTAYTVEVSSNLINNLTFDFSVVQQQSDCINPDGGLEVINVAGGSGNYSYQWHQGATLDFPITGANTTLLNNIRSNQYTILITDNNTGCTKDSTFTLPSSVTPIPPPTLTITDVDTCVPGNTGQVVGQVDPTILSGIPRYSGYSQDDFFYYWFEGRVEDGAVQYNDPLGDLNDPTNYQTFGPAPTLGGGNNNRRTLSGLEPGWYTVVIVDARNYILSGGTDPFECQSDPRSFEVKAIAQSPLVTENLNAADSLCVGNSGRTILEVTKRATDVTAYGNYQLTSAQKDGSTYTFNTGDVTENHTDPVSTFTIINLESGTYDFEFRDPTTQCDTVVTVNIADNRVPPVLAPDNIQVNSDQTQCNPANGEVEVIASATTGVTNLADYDFYWHDQIATTSADIIDPLVYVGDNAVLSNLDSGTYYVYAVDRVTGCISSYQSIDVDFNVTETQVEITATSPVVDCTPGATDGSISVVARDIDNSGTVTTPLATYSFTWTMSDGSPLPGSAIVSPPTANPNTLSNVPVGIYRVAVRNQDVDCETVYAYDTIRFEPVFPEFTAASVSKQNVTTCTPGDGMITITEIREGGTTIQSTDANFSNYDFTWYRGNTSTVISGETSNVLSNLTVDTYFVTVTNTSTGFCGSPDTLQVVLVDSIVQPLIYELNVEDFIDCTGAFEGVVSVRGEEADGTTPAGGYTFSWSYNGNPTLPSSHMLDTSVPNTETLSNLPPGQYEVTILNPLTGCDVTDTFQVRTQVIRPILTATKTSDQFNCDPAGGAAEVVNVTLNGNVEASGDYQYVWYTNDPTDPANEFGTADGYGLATDSLSANALPAGTYFVRAVSRLPGGCASLPVQITIADSTQDVVVVLDNIADPIVACEPSDDPEGFIEVEVRNSTDVITRWYEGAVITNPADSLIGLSNLLEVENLVPGTYTVWVQDMLTGCETTRTYTIEGVAIPLILSASSSPFTSCVAPNGQVAANVNGGSGNYVYRWLDSSGNAVSSSDDQNLVEGLENGTYTVQVSDRDEPDCEVVTTTVTVDDLRGNVMTVEVSNDFNMTNCDEGNPNGQLSATVAGNPSRYDFFWYEGEDISNRPIAQGPTAAELVPNTYSVVARDKITGCLSDPVTGMVIAENTDFRLPIPSTEVLSAVTHCVTPNGSAIAVLDSTQLDSTAVYQYTWYNEEGDEIFRSTNTNIITGLMAEEYSVVVMNLVTGCYSEPATVEIPEDIRVPDFEIVTTPSTCFEASGSITVRFNEEVRVADIEWLTPNGFVNGFFLTDQPPGVYEATIIDDKGCRFTQTGEIESTIYTFNGISPNGDGNNDRFIISCIENFEGNIVRIYNRAGTLVYENENYDNETSYFEGYGNKGLYIAGDKLPDGTYFYIIDKQNGDEPSSGYLELIR
ncbi:gliding motility-associated C-terminal domain-containing protein [Tunicatimonas pelagia]|uniref:T9SS type B sorting domain-containing protein n=1 Tax=Tunicatimonas pelagia TaxID=931531 RepID=UPI002665B055|nr:gliding motility-associated C-terminal domain-containing protein [Tunicatimonas pelagia]WKN43359.1 gliding motility-associated C-terminal domain-containing protein [Tunicatimonas pelagia]